MEDKTYKPEEIKDQPFPGLEEESTVSQSTSGSTLSPGTVKDTPLPTKKSANVLISESLNTQSKKILKEYSFAPGGAIQVGEHKLGEAGDLRLTPDGLTARNKQGDTTFTIDGETGDATFKGTVGAGTLIAGVVSVGNNNVLIDGENKRIIVSDGVNDRILIGFQADGF